MVVKDCAFSRGLGIAIGSIGQLKGIFETIERISISRITFSKTLHAVNPALSSIKPSFINTQRSSISKRGQASKLTIPLMVAEVV
jgi:hypothetical protein